MKHKNDDKSGGLQGCASGGTRGREPVSLDAKAAQLQYLSTTALAKKLGREGRDLFALFAEGGWLLRVDKSWQLTAKGCFEGGILLEHPRYGEYVAWPEAVISHPLVQGQAESLLSASKLAQKLKAERNFTLSARLLNRVLADLGWLQAGPKGWLLTAAGRALGGQQLWRDKTAIPYVCWPQSILQSPGLLASLDRLDVSYSQTTVEGVYYASLSGRLMTTVELRILDSWLYLQGLHYCSGRPITDTSLITVPVVAASVVTSVAASKKMHRLELSSDFYIAAQRLHIVYWPESDKPADIAKRLALSEQLRAMSERVLEWRFESGFSLMELDEKLPAELLSVGIAVY